MKQYGINAVAIFQDQDEDVLNDILGGVYSLVYTSPESMLGTKKWEKLWKCHRIDKEQKAHSFDLFDAAATRRKAHAPAAAMLLARSSQPEQ